MQVVKKDDFTFYVSERDHILILSLVGVYTKDAGPLLKQMEALVTSKTAAKLVIFNLRGLESLSHTLIPGFVQLQRKARQERHLILAGMKQEVSEQLALRGVIRASELTGDLQRALEIWKILKPR